MNWLLLFFAFEMGALPSYELRSYEDLDNTVIDNFSMYTQLEVEAVIFDYFFVSGGIKTSVFPRGDRLGFVPYESDYIFGAGIRMENIEIGYRHLCIHPTLPYRWFLIPSVTYDGAYDEVYLRISNRED